MSDLVRLYLTSRKPTVSEARVIPGQEVNYIDIPNEWQVGWSNYQELYKTTFTDAALNHWDDEVATMVIPPSFQPIEEGIPLNRWGPGKGYYNPGSGR